jgi:hypothetical protein
MGQEDGAIGGRAGLDGWSRCLPGGVKASDDTVKERAELLGVIQLDVLAGRFADPRCR